MSKSPLEQAAAEPLPTVGEGCLQRYDPDALSSEHGTEFPGAMQAWQNYLLVQNAQLPCGTDAPVARQNADCNGEKK